MKILQVNYTDLLGSRFNGRDLNTCLRSWGHEAHQCVWHRFGDDRFTWSLAYKVLFRLLRDKFTSLIRIVEWASGIQSLLYPWPLQLFYDKRFLRCDVIHYHLLHTGFFSLLAMPKLTAIKPSIWTIHDPWLMTGHCVYPEQCERWQAGCGACPNINSFIPMRFDNTRRMFERKKEILSRSRIDIVVASKFMLDMAQKSPILSGHTIHHIPFGIDTSIFERSDASRIRDRYGIPAENLVISFRSTDYEYKGLPYIKEALRRVIPDQYAAPLTLLTINCKGLVEEFRDRFQIVELGLLTGESVLADFYNCSDIFLMPSTGEAFGMMAIEAMACGVPVIGFEGTSLPEILFAPAGGVCVPMKDADALYRAIDRLLKEPADRRAIGDEAYRLSRAHYRFEDHAKKMLALYEEVVASRKEGV